MDGADVWAADGMITRAIGEEICRVRRSIGWTRSQLVERMPTDIHIRTLAAYEQGARQCAIVRLVEICVALGWPHRLSWVWPCTARRSTCRPSELKSISTRYCVTSKPI
jgi:hypothetical protein